METFSVDDYIKNPVHPITIAVIGAGATGSLMMTKLARINIALNHLKQRSLAVCLYDDDLIMQHNLGKQLFMPAEVGLPKSKVLVTRLNRFFGFGWSARYEKITNQMELAFNIIISCTDSVESRKSVEKAIYNANRNQYRDENQFCYWLDCGNAAHTGNVVLTDLKLLPTIFELHPDLKKHEKSEEPSCSLAESLERQSLFVNDYTADMASLLLWDLLTKSELDWYGGYFNIETLKFQKLRYDENKIQILKTSRRNNKNKKQQETGKTVRRPSGRGIHRRNIRT